MENPFNYQIDIHSISIPFMPHEPASNYCNKLESSLHNMYPNVDEIKELVQKMENIVEKYSNITSPIKYQPVKPIVQPKVAKPKAVKPVKPKVEKTLKPSGEPAIMPSDDYSTYTIVALTKICKEKGIDTADVIKNALVQALGKQ